jgi:hypothetical protein
MKSEKEIKSLTFIFRSFTSNQNEIIKLVANSQLKATSEGIPFKDLYEKCVEEMIISSESQLKENLLLVLDHKVLEQRRSPLTGKVVYIIPYSRAIIEKIASGCFEAIDS